MDLVYVGFFRCERQIFENFLADALEKIWLDQVRDNAIAVSYTFRIYSYKLKDILLTEMS